MSLGTRQTEKVRRGRNKRIRGLALFLVGLAALMAGRLAWLQIIEAPTLKEKARQSRIQPVSLYSRGRILDRKGTILAQDTVLYDVYTHPQYYRQVTPALIADVMAPVLKQPRATLRRKLAEPYSTITVAKNISKAQQQALMAARITLPRIDTKTGKPIVDPKTLTPLTRKVPIPGLDIVPKTVRNYPQGQLAAHVIGYVNDEAGNASGIEKTAENRLRTVAEGGAPLELNGRGEVINVDAVRPDLLVRIPNAQDVSLTLDAHLQYIAERELAKGIERSKAERGTLIMTRPKTGEILAFAVFPSYHPDHYAKASASTLKNWALSDVYPPGSTIKILTLACGLESGVINRHSRIQDTGRMTLGGWSIQNYDYGKHGAPGDIDLVYLLQHSSNIASAKIAQMMAEDRYRALLKQFGLGQKTGIDLPGESAGILHDDWDPITQATIGYGYGLASTPLQMIAAVGAVANGGEWITPHLNKNATGIERRRVLRPETAQTLTELMTQSIETAPQSTVKIDGVPVAGKTGTSRKPREKSRGYDAGALYTSFVGYFPAQNPEVLMMVVVDSPRAAESWGSTVAGPIFHAVATETLQHLGLKTRYIKGRL
jgi:cell division protein FtsI (penicillin-binding protein 3)